MTAASAARSCLALALALALALEASPQSSPPVPPVDVRWDTDRALPMCSACNRVLAWQAPACRGCSAPVRWTPFPDDGTPGGALRRFKAAIRFRDRDFLREQLTADSARDLLDVLLESPGSPDGTPLVVAAVREDGDRAEVECEENKSRATFRLQREGGRWTVDMRRTLAAHLGLDPDRPDDVSRAVATTLDAAALHACEEHLKGIGKAIERRFAGNGGKFPGPGDAFFRDLFRAAENGDPPDARLLVCPATKRRPDTAALGREEFGWIDYAATARPLQSSDRGARPIVWETEPRHAGCRAVLFLDLTVRTVPEQEFQKLIQAWER